MHLFLLIFELKNTHVEERDWLDLCFAVES